MKNYIDYNTFESHVKDLGCSVIKLDIVYNISDCRCWTAVVNPGLDNILVTFVVNRLKYGSYYFDIITQDRTSFDVYADDIYDILSNLTGKTPVLIELE